MVKKILLLLIFIYSFCIATTDPRFEIGLMIGDPVGLSTKWWYDGRSAFDLVAGWSFPENGRLSIQFDYLFHFARIKFENGELPLYIGLGPELRIKNESFFGGRIPIGITYLLLKAPLSFFGEVAPHVEIIPETVWGADGGVGIRFTF
jgi:hypothetical protein